MHKTFYIPEGEGDLVDKVEEVSDKDSFSATVLEALKEYVKSRDTKSELERKLTDYKERRALLRHRLGDIHAEIEKLESKLKEKGKERTGKLIKEDD